MFGWINIMFSNSCKISDRIVFCSNDNVYWKFLRTLLFCNRQELGDYPNHSNSLVSEKSADIQRNICNILCPVGLGWLVKGLVTLAGSIRAVKFFVCLLTFTVYRGKLDRSPPAKISVRYGDNVYDPSGRSQLREWSW